MQQKIARSDSPGVEPWGGRFQEPWKPVQIIRLVRAIALRGASQIQHRLAQRFLQHDEVAAPVSIGFRTL